MKLTQLEQSGFILETDAGFKLALDIGSYTPVEKLNAISPDVMIVSHKAPQLSLDVVLKGKTWRQALAEDWRKTHSWKPGWEYKLN